MFYNKKFKMSKKYNPIGLDAKKSEKLQEELNDILATYHIYYQNLRGFHWNITGNNFFELHIKFEELYNDALIKIDAIAERILTLGGTPLYTFSDYIKRAAFHEVSKIMTDIDTINMVVSNIGSIIALERKAVKLAQEAEDEGSITLLTDDISEKEKLVWMLNAWLK